MKRSAFLIDMSLKHVQELSLVPELVEGLPRNSHISFLYLGSGGYLTGVILSSDAKEVKNRVGSKRNTLILNDKTQYHEKV